MTSVEFGPASPRTGDRPSRISWQAALDDLLAAEAQEERLYADSKAASWVQAALIAAGMSEDQAEESSHADAAEQFWVEAHDSTDERLNTFLGCAPSTQTEWIETLRVFVRHRRDERAIAGLVRVCEGRSRLADAWQQAAVARATVDAGRAENLSDEDWTDVNRAELIVLTAPITGRADAVALLACAHRHLDEGGRTDGLDVTAVGRVLGWLEANS